LGVKEAGAQSGGGMRARRELGQVAGVARSSGAARRACGIGQDALDYVDPRRPGPLARSWRYSTTAAPASRAWPLVSGL